MYVYLNCCINLPERFIHRLKDNSTEISAKTFRKYVKGNESIEIIKQFGYKSFNQFKDDYCVSFYKSKCFGQMYYYFSWSSIEYVFEHIHHHESED